MGEPRRVAFRQCDVERALRAAKVAGAARVVVRQDGSLVIELVGEEGAAQGLPLAGRRREIVL